MHVGCVYISYVLYLFVPSWIQTDFVTVDAAALTMVLQTSCQRISVKYFGYILPGISLLDDIVVASLFFETPLFCFHSVCASLPVTDNAHYNLNPLDSWT